MPPSFNIEHCTTVFSYKYMKEKNEKRKKWERAIFRQSNFQWGRAISNVIISVLNFKFFLSAECARICNKQFRIILFSFIYLSHNKWSGLGIHQAKHQALGPTNIKAFICRYL